MNSHSPLFAPLMMAILALATSSTLAQQKFPVISLNAGMYIIKAELAISETEHQQGLMFRKKMDAHEGMVFAFKAPAKVCMWMKDTLLPLSVAFIEEDGKIVNIEDMVPKTTDSHCSQKQVRYALEMNQGWFKQKNIKPGSTIEGLPSAH
jgi:uncharacterized protein